MHADTYYSIGSTHLVCEDYAWSDRDRDGNAFVLVADGCSSSPDTDVGARLLCHSAARMLRSGHGLVLAHVIEQAAGGAEQLGLSPDCLDATLLAARVVADTIRVSLAGDGAVVARRHDGAIEGWFVSFNDSAPAYISYMLDDDRLGAFMGAQPHRFVEDLTGHTRVASLHADPFVLELELPRADYDHVTLMSDGAQSFCDAAQQRLDVARIALELAAFRSHTGQFVARRTRRFLKQARRRGWQHHDDLAVAALCSCDERPAAPIGGTP